MALWRYYASNGSGVCIVFNDNFYNNNEGNKSISNPCNLSRDLW
ncbi:DUF2971 domain-containing protein [Legionella feeleii]|uniref:DUF2971 domain-containing protein n=1 Tax=Legionella feeleii TaxID=453 RepID=A0A378IRJ5_9GAMM|nr:Uncharacterised protein [Legionella feeleii]